MAGRGPAPKPASRRARRNADPQPQTILRFQPCGQPELPPLPGGFEWSEQTKDWWFLWGQSSQAEHFSSTDWSFMQDTALVHQDVWGFGNLDRLPELRLRVAKFGATLEDRARLRMQFAEADDADSRRPERDASASSRSRYGALIALPGGADAATGTDDSTPAEEPTKPPAKKTTARSGGKRKAD